MDVITARVRIFQDWLGARAPGSFATLRPPAVDAAVSAAEALLQLRFPDQLRDWLTSQGGVSPEAPGSLLAGFTPRDLAQIEAHHAEMLVIATEVWSPVDAASGLAQPAGGTAWSFLPAFVPIAGDDSGDDLVVDLRPGERHGCIRHYDHEQGALTPPVWPDIATMMDDINDALRHSRRLFARRPVVIDGYLDWRL